MKSKTAKDGDNDFDRYDRRIGRLWSRSMAMVLLIVGTVVAINTLVGAQLALSTHWPGLAFAASILFLASLCWRANKGMLSIMSDNGTTNK